MTAEEPKPEEATPPAKEKEDDADEVEGGEGGEGAAQSTEEAAKKKKKRKKKKKKKKKSDGIQTGGTPSLKPDGRFLGNSKNQKKEYFTDYYLDYGQTNPN